MNLRDLAYFVKLAEHKHFGKAAKACFVSQPTLSMQLKKLEVELGVALLERDNKKMMLTSIGERILIHAQRILAEVEQLQNLAKSAQDPYCKEFRLGIIPTMAPYLLPKIIPLLKQNFPKLVFLVQEMQTHVLIQNLRNGVLDAGLLALPIDDESLISQHLYDEAFYVAVPAHHPLTAKKQVTQADLAGQSLLLLDEGHCLRDQALDICNTVGAGEQQNFRATSLETLRQMVGVGSGITLMPEMAIQPYNKNIQYVPFSKPIPKRSIGIIWRATSTDKDLLTELTSKLKIILQNNR